MVPQLVPDLVENLPGDADSPGVGEGTDPTPDVHCVPKDVAPLSLDVTDVYSNTDKQAVGPRNSLIPLVYPLLYLYGKRARARSTSTSS